ncbi:MAG: hypothetical protein ACYC3I_06485 [Gemmataceae bacterium]
MKATKKPRRKRTRLDLYVNRPWPAAFNGGYQLDPLGPTEYLQGTEGKIRVLQDRASRRVRLFHPDDA